MTTERIRFGIAPPVTGPPPADPSGFARHLAQIAVAAEQLGFDSFWMGDSLLRARVEPLAVLSHVAALTTDLTLGTAALIAAYRQPISAAQTLASLDLLTGGRLVLGVGAGFPGRSEPEFALAAVPTARRSARLDDTVALWRHLWSIASLGAAPVDAERSFHGALFDYDELPDRYQTHRAGGPPIWLAAGNQAALGRAGRLYDGWLPYPPTAAAYAHGLAAVGEAATRAGRAMPTAALFATIAVAADESHGRRILADFCQDSYRAPLEYIESIQTTIAGPADHIQAELGRFVDAGARHIIIRLPALEPGPQLDQLYLLAESVRGFEHVP